MSGRHATAAPPALHIGQLRFVTDRALGDGRARALGERFAEELGTALAQAGASDRMDIGELVVEAGGDQLDDRALPRLAAAVARRILERVPD
ncbi:hypothetical protein [Pseudoxanthomonas suwonensis]|uniref:Uncharacterized protein n=1 Tax=Pseudoxanthomonas suwonensis TaxID=314722 RepID=A0A0E3Z3L9_9GAMM|nr:hypothetical protein [Pseudoxanthomonas suwonensis]AKC86783.1 hypothetical protein WQ53_08445 [Pseudoxanthomonas suwonensis]